MSSSFSRDHQRTQPQRFLRGVLIASMLIQGTAQAAAPALEYAAPVCTMPDKVLLKFRDVFGFSDLNEASAEDTSRYSVSGRSVTDAVYNADTQSVRLTLDSALDDVVTNATSPTKYTVSATGVQDTLGQTLPASSDWLYYSSEESNLVAESWFGTKSQSGTPGGVFTSQDIYDELGAGDLDDQSVGILGSLLTGLVDLALGILSSLVCLIAGLFGGCSGNDADNDLATRYRGFIIPPSDGNYRFQNEANDHARFWLDDGTSNTQYIDAYATTSRTPQTFSAGANAALSASRYYRFQQDFGYDHESWQTGFIFKTDHSDSPTLTLRYFLNGSGSVSDMGASQFSNCVPWIPPDDALDHFTVTTPTNGNACNDSAITVSARNVSDTALTDYTGTVTISTSTGVGDWVLVSGNGTLINGAANDGIATYTFTASDNGEISLSLTHRSTGNPTITVTDSDEGISSSSSSIAYGSGGLVIKDNSGYGLDIVAGRPHSLKIEYEAWNGSSCVNDGAIANALNLKLALIPTDDNVGPMPTVPNATSVLDSLLGAVVGGVEALTGLQLLQLPSPVFTLQTEDVADFEIQALAELDLITAALIGMSPGTTLIGTVPGVDSLTVRPFGIVLEPVSPAGAALTNGAVSGLNSASGTGPVFAKAGEAFNISLRAIEWQAADDTNNDGLPDGYTGSDGLSKANLSNNPTTATFSLPTSSISLTSVLKAPAGGNAGTLTVNGVAGGSLNAFVNGISSNTLSFDEVGIIEINANLPAYLNSAVNLVGGVGELGRFIPARFTWDAGDDTVTSADLNQGFLDSDGDGINDWTCNFAYFGQSFGVESPPEMEIRAVNTAGNLTQNYTGAFNRFNASGTIDVTAKADSGATALSAAVEEVSHTVSSSVDGGKIVHNFALAPDAITFERPTSPTADFGPLAADVSLTIPAAALTDTDGVCFDSDNNGSCDSHTAFNLTGLEMRYGRVVMDNVYGPENNELTMPFRIEYWKQDGNGGWGYFANAEEDNCVPITPIQGALTNIKTPNGNAYGLANLPETASAVAKSNVQRGRGTLTIGKHLTTGGDTVAGQSTVTLDVPQYLWTDLDHDGDIDANDRPKATATFGIYQGKGKAPVIFQQPAYR